MADCSFENNRSARVLRELARRRRPWCFFACVVTPSVTHEAGALFARSCFLTLKKTTFSANRAELGGAAYFQELTNYVIESCTFESNEAALFIGASSSGTVLKSSFNANYRTSRMDCVIHLEASQMNLVDSALWGNNAAALCIGNASAQIDGWAMDNNGIRVCPDRAFALVL